MLTTDLALRFDPIYEPISRRFLENPDQLADAFARAWYKLIHRDMGPLSRYLGPEMPNEELLWQDPIPAVDHPLVNDSDVAALKSKLLASGLSVSQLVSTAWAAASGCPSPTGWCWMSAMPSRSIVRCGSTRNGRRRAFSFH